MNVAGISNALTALNSSNGSKAPDAMRAQPAASFRQALSQEVAQRQPAPRLQETAKAQAGSKPPAADKARPAEAASADQAPAPPAAATAQAGEAKPEDRTRAAEDTMAGLADIPGAPQAAWMMQLMHPAPVAAPSDAAPAADAAALASGKDQAGQRPLDLQERAAGKNDAAAAAAATRGQAAAPDLSAPTGLPIAFGKAMNDAASQQATQALAAAGAETPASAPAALAALQAAQAVHAPAPSADKLAPPVGTPAWDQALGQKIVWMARGGEQSASLTMNPPDLGPMKVVLSVSNNQATVDFMTAQPEVREALESALPRLREMMSESGIQLGQANVSTGSQQQFAGFGGQNKGSGGARGNDGPAIDDAAPQARQGVVRIARDGAVDTFA